MSAVTVVFSYFNSVSEESREANISGWLLRVQSVEGTTLSTCHRVWAKASEGRTSKFHELLWGALQGARIHSLTLICYIMLSAGRLARRLKGARESCCCCCCCSSIVACRLSHAACRFSHAACRGRCIEALMITVSAKKRPSP